MLLNTFIDILEKNRQYIIQRANGSVQKEFNWQFLKLNDMILIVNGINNQKWDYRSKRLFL